MSLPISSRAGTPENSEEMRQIETDNVDIIDEYGTFDARADVFRQIATTSGLHNEESLAQMKELGSRGTASGFP